MESHSPYVPVPAHLFCIHSRIVYPHIRFLHDMLYDRVEDADRHLFIYLYSLFSASHHSIGNHRFLSVWYDMHFPCSRVWYRLPLPEVMHRIYRYLYIRIFSALQNPLACGHIPFSGVPAEQTACISHDFSAWQYRRQAASHSIKVKHCRLSNPDEFLCHYGVREKNLLRPSDNSEDRFPVSFLWWSYVPPAMSVLGILPEWFCSPPYFRNS